MEDRLVARAIVAASSLAEDVDLEVSQAVVVQNSNTLALRLLPCDTFARTSRVAREVAALEIQVAKSLAAVAAPVVSLDPRVEPQVYERDGFAVTFWSYYAPMTDLGSPAEYAAALRRLHAAMRTVEIEAPHFTERIAAASSSWCTETELRRSLMPTAFCYSTRSTPPVEQSASTYTKTNSCTGSRILGTSWVPQKARSSSTSRPAAVAPSSSTLHTCRTRSACTTRVSTRLCFRSVVGSSSRWSQPGAGMRATSSRTGVGTPSRFCAWSETGHPGQHRAPSPPSKNMRSFVVGI